MLSFHIKEDIRSFRKGQTFTFEDFPWMVMVGANGSGKSTLMQALRGRFPPKKEITLLADEFKKLADCIEIKTDYEEIIFLDAIIDDPVHHMNVYDACSYVDAGNFQTRYLSHGQKALNLLNRILMAPKSSKKTLVVLDEVDGGLELRYQANFCKLLTNIYIKQGFDSLLITHSPLVMLAANFVYDFNKAIKGEEPITMSRAYLNEQIDFDKIIGK
jgi:ABC-type cobalamin/Fe3+-siderophores transport system ATPase subunit